MNTKTLVLVAWSLTFAACTTTNQSGTAPVADMKSAVPFSSPECLAARLPPGEPFPASAIPEAALSKRQSGWVAVRYDVIDGLAQNLAIVGSSPAGLYDAAAMQHAAKYRVSARGPIRGCVTTIEVKF